MCRVKVSFGVFVGGGDIRELKVNVALLLLINLFYSTRSLLIYRIKNTQRRCKLYSLIFNRKHIAYLQVSNYTKKVK